LKTLRASYDGRFGIFSYFIFPSHIVSGRRRRRGKIRNSVAAPDCDGRTVCTRAPSSAGHVRNVHAAAVVVIISYTYAATLRLRSPPYTSNNMLNKWPRDCMCTLFSYIVHRSADRWMPHRPTGRRASARSLLNTDTVYERENNEAAPVVTALFFSTGIRSPPRRPPRPAMFPSNPFGLYSARFSHRFQWKRIAVTFLGVQLLYARVSCYRRRRSAQFSYRK